MDLQQIAGIVVALGVIGGVTITIGKKRSTKTNIKQNAKSGGDTYQAGRDMNVRK